MRKAKGRKGPHAAAAFFPSRIARSVPLTATRRVWGTWVEGWEHDRRGQPLSHHAWCTDLEVTADKVAASVRRGRSRWKIEHEPFKRQKNHGDALAHNYGHGPQTLSMVFSLLKLLAFLAPMSLERGDRLSQRCLATPSRRELWHTLPHGDAHDAGNSVGRLPVALLGRSRSSSIKGLGPGRDLSGAARWQPRSHEAAS